MCFFQSYVVCVWDMKGATFTETAAAQVGCAHPSTSRLPFVGLFPALPGLCPYPQSCLTCTLLQAGPRWGRGRQARSGEPMAPSSTGWSPGTGCRRQPFRAYAMAACFQWPWGFPSPLRPPQHPKGLHLDGSQTKRNRCVHQALDTSAWMDGQHSLGHPQR